MENRLYKDGYGAWAGQPRGYAPDYAYCCEEVPEGGRSVKFHQCNKKRGHGPDQAYCKIHDPDAVAARREKQRIAYEEKSRKWRYEFYGKSFYDVLVQIAEGHNDARGIAKEIVDKFNAK